MRAHTLLTAAFLVANLALAGCGGDDGPPDDLTGARLEYVSPETHSLRYGASAELRVRYVQGAAATAIPGASLGYEIDGVGGGAGLSALRTDTDSRGEAALTLTAGMTTTSFRVIVTPPEGDPLTFQIGVSDTDAGSVVVDMTYGGTAMLTRFSAYLFDRTMCSSLDPMRLPTALFAASPVTSVRDRPGFSPVPVGTGYAVAVVAEGGGRIAAFGCTDAVAVMLGQQTRVPVTIADLGIRIEGVYDLDNRLDFGGTLPPSVDTGIDILDELTDDDDIMGSTTTMDYGQDPGAFVTDFVMRQTCHWECMASEDYDTCSELNHRTGDISAIYLQNFRTWAPAEARFFGGCGTWEDVVITVQNLINNQISAIVPDALIGLARIGGDLARAINQAHIQSVLTVGRPTGTMAPITHELRMMEVLLHDLAGAEHVYAADLRDVGFAAMPRVDATATLTGTGIQIPSHTFNIDYGRLVQYIYLHGVLPLLGYTSSAEMLRDWINCTAVAMTLESTIGVVDVMTYADYCDTALGIAGSVLDLSISELIDASGTLSLMGTATAADPAADGIARSLTNGMWSGSWGEGGMTGSITGTFTGARAP